MTDYPKTIHRRGMRIDLDVPIEMDDGVAVRADIFRPPDGGEYPVIMSYGRYGKWLHFEDGYPERYNVMKEKYPDIFAGTSGEFMNFEVVDPEQWVPDGYAVVRVDSRGSGRSPGFLETRSHRERLDYAKCIEWAGERHWSNGKVGLNGISYYAINQWQVAELQPDYLSAICVWEGAADRYRDANYHGGIYCDFSETLYDWQVSFMQHGVGENGLRSRITGDWTAGPETLRPEQLGANRTDMPTKLKSNPLASDDHWEHRNPDFSKIQVPLLSAGNWGGHGLHLRGNTEGYMGSETDEKYLEIHGNEHWTEFYTEYGRNLQKRFFDYYLKGDDTGWSNQPSVQLWIRRPGEEFEIRHEDDWPIPRTQFTRYYLDPAERSLQRDPPETRSSLTYEALEDGLTFLTAPLEKETEITGPVSSRLHIASDTKDADLFVVLRAFNPTMEEVVFQGANEPNKPVGLGWLRASHRKLDDKRSEEWRPYHTHDEVEPLKPGEEYELEIEIWPTCIVLPAGYRIGFSIRGTDYEYPGPGTSRGGIGELTGVGPHRHQEADDRPPEVYGGEVTVHSGPMDPSSVLLPVIPDK